MMPIAPRSCSRSPSSLALALARHAGSRATAAPPPATCCWPRPSPSSSCSRSPQSSRRRSASKCRSPRRSGSSRFLPRRVPTSELSRRAGGRRRRHHAGGFPPALASLPALLVTLWIAGAAMFVLPIAAGLWQIRTIRRSGLPWRHGRPVVDPLALDAGIRRRVDLLLHESHGRADDVRRRASRDRAARGRADLAGARICGGRSSTSWSTCGAATG